ncbi:daunorubicin ABC transporter ATP-binding protein [Halorubrum salipaludis]|uniref:Daunorubicin ABC transporter ATP-binding protein n=1 Tax=Halorubrum salipaludis TaxID=2032630 RepID=A0A2A2FFI6_9EURY|nr:MULTISPECIES: sodium-dependent transporter [Halorubrum]PAU83359.1 daunorubicin ABC transporter ATP-binding protein [Halorubrum salipaludis]
MARETWATRAGFILAAVGSAVGLGNIWRFPFITGQEGGGAFLLVYLLFVGLIGFPAILVEFVIGRYTNLNPVGAIRELGGGAWNYLGWLFVAIGFVILSYYSVVAGWFLRYTLIGVTDGYALAGPEEAGQLFGTVTTGIDSLLFHAVFMALVIGIIAAGVRKGIEVGVKVMVPAIIVLLVGLAGYAFTLDAAGAAYAYYLTPDFGYLAANWTSILPAAAGQAFFTLSLGMGVMITYASYLGEDRNLASDAGVIVALDTLIAVIVGFVVFPFLFAAGIEPGGPGASAIFVSLTSAFSTIPGGRLIGVVFFAMVGIAALSSAISILEVLVSYLIDEVGVARVPASVALGVAVFVLGVPVTIDLIFLSLYDGLADGILLVLGSLLLAVFVGWVIPDVAREELAKGIGDLGGLGSAWIWIVRIPIAIVVIVSLYLGVVDYVDFLTGGFADWLAAR